MIGPGGPSPAGDRGSDGPWPKEPSPPSPPPTIGPAPLCASLSGRRAGGTVRAGPWRGSYGASPTLSSGQLGLAALDLASGWAVLILGRGARPEATEDRGDPVQQLVGYLARCGWRVPPSTVLKLRILARDGLDLSFMAAIHQAMTFEAMPGVPPAMLALMAEREGG